MKLSVIAGAAIALTLAANAYAWGPEGHAMVADMAQAHLTPVAQAEVARLLALEGSRNLDEVSSWPDQYRTLHPETGPAHYVDIPLHGLTYDEARDCHFDKDNHRVPELTCVVTELPRQARILADRTKPDEERLIALKWVTHLVGDIHQPLHGEDNDDKGGNNVIVTYFGKATNLHAVWDSGILQKHFNWKPGPDYFSFDHEVVQRTAMEMDAGISAAQRQIWAPQYGTLERNVEEWANESHLYSFAAYLNVPATKGDDWQNAYQETFWPLVQMQMQKASIRLSAVLNMTLTAGQQK
ncbi:MAG: S1/P1 nuclease [Burkholderiaceae bacterium]|nr:S1/P1 nuclease [Burkholderiaceae bacterium]